MGDAFRRPPLEAGILAAIPATILAFALGSNWSPSIRADVQPLRWGGLLALCVLAVAYALGQGRPLLVRSRSYVAAGALIALAFVSAAWSVDPKLTLGKALAFAVLLVTAAALGIASARDVVAARRILVAVLAGAVAVALTGLAVYAVKPGEAVQPATASVPTRFRGIGGNPNTVAMLLAVGLPLAAFLFLDGRSRRSRIAAAAAFLLLAGSIVASGSRGALAAGFGAVFFFALVAMPGWRHRALAAALVAGLLVLSAAVTQLPKPLSPNDPRAHKKSPSGAVEHRTPNDADYAFRLEDEIDAPHGAVAAPRRGLFVGSGRAEAWKGAIEQGAHRPLLGFGFGAEDLAFVDRYYQFQGGVPENSFIGFFLQLGAVGLLIFLLFVATLVRACVLGLRSVDQGGHRLAAACSAVLVAGLVLAVVQSYVYAVGNLATLSVWIAAFLPLAQAERWEAR